MIDDIFLLVKKSCLVHSSTGECVDKNHSLIYPMGAYISMELANEGKQEIEKRFGIEHVNSNGSTPDLEYDVLTVRSDNLLVNYAEHVYLLARKFCIRDQETGKCVDDEFQGVHYISGHSSKELANIGKLGLEERLRQEGGNRYESQPNLIYEVIPVSIKG